MSSNEHLNKAKIKKDDEFYTSYKDVCTIMDGIEKDNYDDYTVYVLPCDTFENKSNFIKYCLDKNLPFIIMDDFHDMKNIVTEHHKIEVVTNPPFSKLKEFLAAYYELTEKVPAHWDINLTFICPQPVAPGIFKKYFDKFVIYDCLEGLFTKPDENIERIPVCLASTHDYNTVWYKDSFAFAFVGCKVFKQTKDAMIAVYTKQVWDYFYVTRAALNKQCFFKEHGFIIDYSAGYNDDLIKQSENPEQFNKFGMIKFIQDPDYDWDEYDD